MDENNNVALGNTGIFVSPIGLGTMQWGFRGISGLTKSEIHKITCDIFQDSLNLGINFFDTAEMYGSGKSEIFLGVCNKECTEKNIIASKFMPYPWRLSKGELRKALKQSLKRLGLTKIDLYQMHWPFPPIPIRTWMDGMADLIEDGLIGAVGVSNYSAKQMKIAYDQLAGRGIPLASNQVKYNLLDRRAEKNGVMDLGKNLGVTLIAYSPLERGILTGKYTSKNMPTDYRSWRYNKKYLQKIEPLIVELKNIANEHGEKTPGQVALNWLVAKSAIPIPGARNIVQAKENGGALGWTLSQEEVETLDRISNITVK